MKEFNPILHKLFMDSIFYMWWFLNYKGFPKLFKKRSGQFYCTRVLSQMPNKMEGGGQFGGLYNFHTMLALWSLNVLVSKMSYFPNRRCYTWYWNRS